MKNKGFTLIELLAVIVILAIIALIATPIILGIINDARDEAKARSAEMVYTGVQYAYTTALYNTTEGSSVGTVTLDDIEANLNIENMKDATVSGTVLTIETEDDVTCTVTAGADGYVVECGEYLDATTMEVATK